MNGRAHRARVEGAKYGASFGSALAIAISYTTNHSILWAIIHGILSFISASLVIALSRCRGFHLVKSQPDRCSASARSSFTPTRGIAAYWRKSVIDRQPAMVGCSPDSGRLRVNEMSGTAGVVRVPCSVAGRMV
jgi:hypothetical protein